MAKSQIDSQMSDGLGKTVPSGSPGTYNADKPPFNQPGDGRVFQQKIYDQVKNGARGATIDSTMDKLGRMGTIPGGGYAKGDGNDD